MTLLDAAIVKGSPYGAGLQWSCLHAHSTTDKLIPMIHPTQWKGYLFHAKGYGDTLALFNRRVGVPIFVQQG